MVHLACVPYDAAGFRCPAGHTLFVPASDDDDASWAHMRHSGWPIAFRCLANVCILLLIYLVLSAYAGVRYTSINAGVDAVLLVMPMIPLLTYAVRCGAESMPPISTQLLFLLFVVSNIALSRAIGQLKEWSV